MVAALAAACIGSVCAPAPTALADPVTGDCGFAPGGLSGSVGW